MVRGASGKASLLLLLFLLLLLLLLYPVSSGWKRSAPPLPSEVFIPVLRRRGFVPHITSPSGEGLSSFQPVPAHSCYSPVRSGRADVVPGMPSP